MHVRSKISRLSPIALVLAAIVTWPGTLSAQGPVRRDRPGRASQTEVAPRYPDLNTRREIALTVVGTGTLVAGMYIPVRLVSVPTVGLDPSRIRWGRDRASLGRPDNGARGRSDWTRNAALAFPLVLSAVGSEGWDDFGARSMVYVETMLASQGATLITKAVWARPRPFAYLAEADRPDDGHYDAGVERAFRSMPSGHASSAWTGATLGMTEHLLSRPQATAAERIAVGFVGGALAGWTSALRVDAGQHFPSDVLVGSGFGVATGVAIPLLHRGRSPLPTTDAWLQMLGGAGGGVLFAVVVLR